MASAILAALISTWMLPFSTLKLAAMTLPRETSILSSRSATMLRLEFSNEIGL